MVKKATTEMETFESAEGGTLVLDYIKRRYRVTGAAPLFLHSTRGMDKFDPECQALKELVDTHHSKKTDETWKQIFEKEFFLGLYLDEDSNVVIPGEMIEAMIATGARRLKKGPRVKEGVMSPGLWPLLYDGPKGDPEALWAQKEKFADIRPVGIGAKKTNRCRPIFRKWALEFEVEYLPDVLNERDLDLMVQLGGRFGALGDWRPKYGRFMVEWSKSV